MRPRLAATKGTLVVTCRLLGGNPEATAAAAASPATTDFRPASPGLTRRRGPALVRLPSRCAGGAGRRGGQAPGWPSWTPGQPVPFPALFLPGAAAEHRADLPLK